MILQSQQRFKSKKHIVFIKSKRHNVFIEEINQITSSSNDGKIMYSNDLIETYAYGTYKALLSDTKVINFCDVTKENLKKQCKPARNFSLSI